MKTRLISRITLMSLLVSAAAACGAALAETPAQDAHVVSIGQPRFDESSLYLACWRNHHHYRHCHHRRHWHHRHHR